MPTNLWQPGQSGNLAGRTRGSRNKLSEEVVCALLRDFREHGQKAIAKVRPTQPAAYLKVLALLVPREHKVEHSNVIKSLSDEELEANDRVHRDLACSAGWRTGKNDRGNDRTYDRRSYGAARARASETKEPADARDGRRGPPEGAQAAQGAIACGDVTSRCGGSVALRRAASCRWQKTIGQAARTCRPPVVISPSKSP